MFVIRDDVIYAEDEYADEIYFIVKGRINFVVTEEMYDYKSLNKGSYFGDIEVVKRTPRKYKTRAAWDVELLVMQMWLTQIVFSDFP
jgi:hypothetical protein